MAIREDEFDLDFGGLDDFDFGDPFTDGTTPKDDRKPATKFAAGFLQGVQDTAKKPSTYVDFMRKALPDGYSAAYDVVDDVAGKGIGLYNEVVTDLRPAMRDLKRIMFRAKTAIDSVLPDSLSKKLDGWLKDKEQEARSSNNYDPTELKITSDLAEIFKVQAQDKDQDDQEQLLHQAVESKRHRTQTEQLDEIRISLKQLASYQDSITYAYQRKSLELQYRQYYAQRDLLEITKAGTQESVSILRDINKNTALPDIQKTLNSELMGRLTKERLYGVVQDRVAPFAREFLSPFFQNISKRVKEKTSELRDTFSMAAMGLEQGSEMADMVEEMGGSKEVEAGKMAGGGALGIAARWLGKKARPHFEKNAGIVAGGYKAGYLAENYDVLLKERLEEYTPSNPIMQMLQEAALETLRIRRGTKVGYDDISRATERANWDNLQRKTLVEIIPGLLSRLLQSSEGIRTGKMGDLPTYDHKTNQFTTVGAMAQTIRTQAIDTYNLDRLANRTGDVIDKLDPTKSIDPELRQKLQLFLIEQARQGKGFSSKKFTDDYELMQGGFKYQEAEKIADAVRLALDTDYDGKVPFTPEAQKLQMEIARDIRSLRELIPSVYEYANVNTNTGNREAVRLAGLSRRSGNDDVLDDRFLTERVRKHLKGETDETATAEVPTDSTNLPNAAAARQRTSFSRSNLDAIMESVAATQKVNQTLLQDFKAGLDTFNEKTNNQSEFGRLIAVIREESTKASALEASRTLREILEIVDELRVVGVPSRGPATVTEDSPDARNWRRTKKVGSFIRGTGKTLFKPVRGLLDLGKGLSSGITGKMGDLWNGARNIGSGLFNPLREKFQDIYVPGYADAKLTAAKMEAGEYFDQLTQKPIKSIRDIKGAVVDKTGQVVLELKDIKRGLMTADGKPIGTRILGMIGSGFGTGLGFVKDQLGKGITLPFSISSKAVGGLIKTFRKTPDVYVMGEGNPRLISGLLRAGHYISAKTRKAIHTVEDIDGDILDSVTGEVVLSASDAAKGLVDRWGKPIKTLLGKFSDTVRKGMGLGMGALKWGGGQLLKGFGAVKDLATKGWEGLKGLASNVHIGGVKMDPVVNAVDRIYDLLVKYFAGQGMSEDQIEASGVFNPDTGDVNLRERPKSITERLREKAESLKDRAGSWWNLKKQRGEKPTDVKRGPLEKPQEKKSNGWLGILTAVLGSLGGSIVSAIKWLGGIIGLKAGVGALGDLVGGDGPDRKKGGRGKGGGGSGGAKRGIGRRILGGLGTGLWTGLKWGGRAAIALPGVALRVGAGLASMASAPVVLTAAAAAAVGYVGYRAYRYYKDRLAPLQRVRFSQYGLPLDALDKCTIVGQLEMDAVKNVVWSEGKAINIDSRFDLVPQLERFGIDVNDKRAVNEFANWYQNRFKPVYLTHLSVLSKVSPGTSLQESDSISDYQKSVYVRASKYNVGTAPEPYLVTSSPFPDLKLVTGREIIDHEVRKIVEEHKDAKRPDVKANAEMASKRPAITPTELPKPGSTAGSTSVPKRTEFVTMASPATSPIGSMINPASTNQTALSQAAKRNEFVTLPSDEETAAELNKAPKPDEVGNQPRSELYNTLPEPNGNGNWDAVKNTLIAAASAMGIDVRKLAMLAKLESSFDTYARAKTSSAKGLFQFISSTWRGLMDKYADKFGIPKSAQPTDPKAASLLAGQFLKQNENVLSKALGKVPDLTESYLAHFLGAGGARTFLSADKTALAKDVLPQAAAANRSIFYNRDSSPRTVADVIDVMRKKVEGASTVVNTAPKTITSSSGDTVAIAPSDTFDDGRANRSAAIPKAPSESVLTTALPTPPPRLGADTTASQTPYVKATAPGADATIATPAELEQKEIQRQTVRKRQLEQQQLNNAQLQRDDIAVAVELARESLVVQKSMDNSLRAAVIHLSNLEHLAKQEKPETPTTPVNEKTLSTIPATPAPIAKVSTARRYV